MEIWIHPAVREEVHELPLREEKAMENAFEKLRSAGPTLRFPHQSKVMGSKLIRELRPRSGRSRWRCLYSRVEDSMVILAVAPEAVVDPRGFAQAVRVAEERLAEIEGVV